MVDLTGSQHEEEGSGGLDGGLDGGAATMSDGLGDGAAGDDVLPDGPPPPAGVSMGLIITLLFYKTLLTADYY